jgi:hypothetical protein
VAACRKEYTKYLLCEIWGSHGSEDGNVVVLGCDVAWTCG